MKYIVIVNYVIRGTAWKTLRREFGDLDAAKEYARTMYDSVDTRKGEEVIVLLYELIESLN